MNPNDVLLTEEEKNSIAQEAVNSGKTLRWPDLVGAGAEAQAKKMVRWLDEQGFWYSDYDEGGTALYWAIGQDDWQALKEALEE